MKYYRLENSVDTKEIGRHATQIDYADKKNYGFMLESG